MDRLDDFSSEATNRILSTKNPDVVYITEIQQGEELGATRIDVVEAIRNRMWERGKSWARRPKEGTEARVIARFALWLFDHQDPSSLLEATQRAGVPLYMAVHLFYGAVDDEMDVLQGVLVPL